MARGLLCALAALVVLAPAVEAANVQPSGSVVVRWQSNPDTCGSFGLCGRSGTVSWRPGDEALALEPGSGIGYVGLFGSRAVVRSHREGDQRGDCIEALDAPSDLQLEPAGGGRDRLTMRHVEDFGFGRCAGPLGSDFMAALPQSQPIAVSALRTGALIDMRGRTPFSAGPFAGEVVSTLTLRARALRQDDSSNGQSFVPKVRKGRLARNGVLTVTYGIDRVAGDAGFSFSGTAGPACEAFDVCGLTGDLGFHADIPGGRVIVSSVRALGGGQKETKQAALAALRAGGTHVFGQASIGPDEPAGEDASVALPITESAAMPAGETCVDSTTVPEIYLNAHRAAAGVRVSLVRSGNQLPDTLRTRCPGPSSDDLGTLAAGTLPLSAIGGDGPELALRPAADSHSLVFDARGHGHLDVALKLVSVRVSTRVFRVTHEDLSDF